MSPVVAVVGAGTMGVGIALLAAHHGCTVHVLGRSAAALDGARRRIGGTLAFLATEGYCDRAAAETAAARPRLHRPG